MRISDWSSDVCSSDLETRPEPPLLPKNPVARARVRALAMIAVADTHPLVVPRIRGYITGTLGHGEDDLNAWIRHWQEKGLEAIEAHLARDGAAGTYCEGDRVTLADVCLVPQVGAAALFDLPLDPYPNAKRIFDECMKLQAFQEARPQAQPDFPEAMRG